MHYLRSLNIIRLIVCSLLLVAAAETCSVAAQPSNGDSDEIQLERAIEYFNSGKYHEAVLLFQQLDSRYELNHRYLAYMGLCYYYEWQYAEAVNYFEKALPKLDVLAPQELSMYYYALAESYFNLSNYDKAIPCYERHLLLCHDNEKGDTFYRLGFIYMFREDWSNARDFFLSALLYYERYRRTPDLNARTTQLRTMIIGCHAKAQEKANAETRDNKK